MTPTHEQPPPVGLTAALAAFQADLPTIGKDNVAKVETKTGRNYVYRYADLADIAAVVLPALGRHGLAFCASTVLTAPGRVALVCELRHVSGESIRCDWPLPDTTDAQTLGSAITYGRRYSLMAMTGVHPAAEDEFSRPGGAAQQPSVPPAPLTAVLELARACGVDGDNLAADVAARHDGRTLADLTVAELREEYRHWHARWAEQDQAATDQARQEANADATGQ